MLSFSGHIERYAVIICHLSINLFECQQENGREVIVRTIFVDLDFPAGFNKVLSIHSLEMCLKSRQLLVQLCRVHVKKSI